MVVTAIGVGAKAAVAEVKQGMALMPVVMIPGGSNRRRAGGTRGDEHGGAAWERRGKDEQWN